MTPDMVGQQIAVFTVGECKDGSGRPTTEQVTFLDNVKAAGGRAAVLRSPEDAVRLVTP